MSAFSALPNTTNNTTNNNTTHLAMQQLKDDAVALEGRMQFEQSLEKFEELLVSQQQTLGDNHQETTETKMAIMRVIEAINNSGDTSDDINKTSMSIFAEGRYEESLKVAEQAYEMARASKGEDHPSTLDAMVNLGATLNQLGRNEEGLSLLERALTKRTLVFGREHRVTMRTMCWIGTTLRSLKKYDQSLTVLEETLDLQTRVLGGEHSETLSTMSHMSNTLNCLGRRAESLDLNEKVLEVRSRVLGDEDPETGARFTTFLRRSTTFVETRLATKARPEGCALRGRLATKKWLLVFLTFSLD